MSDQLEQLQSLQVELHEVNQQLSKAARPLRLSDELNTEQRRKLASDLQGWLARWDVVTQQISHVIFTGDKGD